jgi:hypothetical protein
VYTSLPALSVRYATEHVHSIGFDSLRQAACTHLSSLIHEPASRAHVLRGWIATLVLDPCFPHVFFRLIVSNRYIVLNPVATLCQPIARKTQHFHHLLRVAARQA